MRLFHVITAATLALAATALAQTPPQPGAPREPGERRQMRRPPPGDFRGGMMMMTDRLAEMLELDETQQAQFDDIAARYRERFEERRQQGEDMRALFEEMREAREAGDDARVDEIREKLREARRGGDELRTEFLDEVEKILREDQIERLNQFRERMARGFGRGEGGPMFGMADRLREELKLSEEQSRKFDELLESLREKMRGLRDQPGGDRRDAFGRLMEEFYSELEPILDAEQVKVLAEYRDRARQAGRGDELRELFRAVRRLDLTEDQTARLRAIEQEARRSQREMNRRDREAVAELTGHVKDQVLELLTPEQADQLEKLLSERDRPERGADRQRPRDRRRAPDGSSGGV
jgi:Spy/CpxP family protein refolding chaperone